MKPKIKLFSDIPINAIIIPILLIFLLQVFISMFYNNNNLTFYSIHSFDSLTKADTMANSNWTDPGRNIPGLKEINGFLYPFIVSLLIKLFGKYNVIPVLYVISFFVFLLISIIFYKIAYYFFGGNYSKLTTVVFIITAPVMLSVFSGADVILIDLLFALNVYYIYFYAPAKDYKMSIIISIILLFTNYAGIIYGLSSLFYIALSMNEKKIKDNYVRNVLILISCFVLFCIIFCGFIFIEKITPSFIEQNVLKENKTFYVHSFFKDGFLWSKLIPPFLSIFFFISLFMRYSNEIREKKISFMTYALLVSIAAFIIEFFAVFSIKTDTVLFIAPFFFLFTLLSMDGIFYFADLIQRKNSIFTKNNLILGLILFVILYNIIWSFTLTIEKNNDIRQQHGNVYVEKFFEK